MGGSSSKSSIVNETINNTVTEVLTENISRQSSEIIQNAEIIIGNVSGSKISGVSISQMAKIDMSMMLDEETNLDVQNKMIAALEAKAVQSQTTFPSLTATKSESEVKNLITNNVRNTFSKKNVTEQLSISRQNAKIKIGDVSDGAEISNITINQEAETVAKMVGKMSNSITSSLITESTSKADVTQEQKNPVSEVVDSVGNIITGIFDSGSMIIIAIVVIAGLGGIAVLYFLFGAGASSSSPGAQMMNRLPMNGNMPMPMNPMMQQPRLQMMSQFPQSIAPMQQWSSQPPMQQPVQPQPPMQQPQQQQWTPPPQMQFSQQYAPPPMMMVR